MKKEKEAPLAFEKYQYGALAEMLRNTKESQRFAPGALEVLAGKKGLNLGEEAEGFVQGAMSTPKGIEIATQTYNGAFNKKRDEYKPAQLASWYMPVLAGLDKAEVDKILGVLNQHDETLAQIKATYKRASYLANAPEGVLDTKQIGPAKEIAEEYGNILSVLAVLDSYKFETFRGEAVGATRVKELKGLAAKL